MTETARGITRLLTCRTSGSLSYHVAAFEGLGFRVWDLGFRVDLGFRL